jgi:hypothetical protein
VRECTPVSRPPPLRRGLSSALAERRDVAIPQHTGPGVQKSSSHSTNTGGPLTLPKCRLARDLLGIYPSHQNRRIVSERANLSCIEAREDCNDRSQRAGRQGFAGCDHRRTTDRIQVAGGHLGTLDRSRRRDDHNPAISLPGDSVAPPAPSTSEPWPASSTCNAPPPAAWSSVWSTRV